MTFGHPFRHISATQLQVQGQDSRTIQDLMAHMNLNTTMIDTHVLMRSPLVVISPAESL